MISLVVGLGNIGLEYVGTRHNLGFEVVSRVARELGAAQLPTRPNYESAVALVKETTPDSERLILALPTTLMNRSGLAVWELLDEVALPPSKILVVVDDINLPLGGLRFRSAGSDGGHNGLASIIERLETENIPRLRLGTGPPADNEDVTRFVLSRFSEKELETVERMVAKGAEAIIFAVTHRLEEAMSKYNSNPALPEER